MSRRRRLLVVVAAVGTAVAISATGSTASPGFDDNARGGGSTFRVELNSYTEVPLALSTPGTGSFRLQIDDRAQQITYRLSYANMSSDVTQAHVHFGSVSQAGGISFFLCSNLGNGPAGTQACPAAPGTITGTVTPADVIGPTTQGIAAGEFAEIVKAIRIGLTYVNVHTTTFPPGEIRAQLGHH